MYANFLVDSLLGVPCAEWYGDVLVIKTMASDHRVVDMDDADIAILPELLRRYAISENFLLEEADCWHAMFRAINVPPTFLQ